MNKQELRKEIRKRVGMLDALEKQRASDSVCRQIVRMPIWQRARKVLLYEALSDEISLRELINLAAEEGKTVLMPEPSADAKPLTDLEDIDLAIIPGRAFSSQGARMGRGKGYYDRLLSVLDCPKIGVAFRCQLFEDLPTDSWDMPMNEVVLG
ncbi:MAG: 5-formyltetrahydrofolate cyclo-ligase [Bacteroidales bacterium]|nr:5-formyltetrahydrofolate cyclo-ligase [Bacteroidales bacterium]